MGLGLEAVAVEQVVGCIPLVVLCAVVITRVQGQVLFHVLLEAYVGLRVCSHVLSAASCIADR